MIAPNEIEARDEVLALGAVSRETEHNAKDLDAYVELLTRWQAKINLVAPATLGEIWRRHILDSAQILSLAPSDARIWVDLGSGAGLPGMVLAILLKDRSGAEVHLVESDRRKSIFLSEAARITNAPAKVHLGRLEQVLPRLADDVPVVDVVTARALAPLPKLVDWVHPHIEKGALGLFPKGKDHVRELTDAAKYRSIQFSIVPSRTDPAGAIICATAAAQAASKTGGATA